MLDSALFFQQQAHALNTGPGQRSLRSLILSRLGIIHESLGNNDSAFYYYRAALRSAHSMGGDHLLNLGFAQLRIAQLYNKLHQSDSSLHYARLAFDNAQQVSSKKRQLDAGSLLVKLYQDKNKPDSAFYYQQVVMDLKDSVFGQEKFKQLQLLVSSEQQRQHEVLTKQAQARARFQLIGLLSAMGVFVLIALLLWRNNRHKQRAFAMLQKQKEETDKQKAKVELTLEELKSTQAQLIQSEKMASLGELTAGIAHEIQNPLNFVNNFSEINKDLLIEMKDEMIKGNIDNANTIANDVINNEEKINHHGKRADAIVKGMLQHSRTPSSQKEPISINALADEYLRLSYHGLRARDNSFAATMKTDYDESIGSINIIPQDIGRVLLNLYTNAFYAVTENKKQHLENYEPTVSVSTKKINNKIEIKVKDNGDGIPQKVLDKIFQPFFTTKPTGQGTGLGLSLSYDIIKAHGGDIKVATVENEGTVFTILLPTGII
jgi:signal transduction histidine kinase